MLRSIIQTITFFVLIAPGLMVSAQQSDSDKNDNWTYHFQMTGIMQGHPSFPALYSGKNNLNDSSENNDFSLTSTLFLGRRLWSGAAIFFNPEVSGGEGFSGTKGVAGFPNGEIYRVGNPSPTPYIARAYFRQSISLGNSSDEKSDDDINKLAGTIPSSRITISLGKFSLADFFDDNKYSHDARSQFLNWGLMDNGAYDYPANTRGYTSGIVIEYIQPTWAIRIASVLVPAIANSMTMDDNISKAHGETYEFEKKYKIKTHEGTLP